MEKLLLTQEKLKEAIKAEQEAKIFMDETVRNRIEAQKEYDDARQQYINENKTFAVQRKCYRIWTDKNGEQHKIEYFVV